MGEKADEVVTRVLNSLDAQTGKETIYLKVAVDRAHVTQLTSYQKEQICRVFLDDHPEYEEYRSLKTGVPVKWQSRICTTVFTKAKPYDVQFKFEEALSDPQSPGERIIKMRRERGMTRKKLALESGVNYRSLQQYELGERDIQNATAVTVKKIADALCVQMEDIMG